MRTKAARQIRAGIMSRCLPYTSGEDDYGFYTCLDFEAWRAYQAEWERWKHTPLAQQAHVRTKEWAHTNV